MKKNLYRVIGVMSGTSLDGIDIALVNFSISTTWDFEILKAETVPYSAEWKNRLSSAINLNESALEELNTEYTIFLARKISEFITGNSVEDIEAVCSHGHTVKHEPQKGLTLQIGNLPLLAQILKQKVICDFRVQDVELGGQGAPLVPIGDELLFSQFDSCLNLGGFANISLRKNSRRIAYDICPVNTVLNFYSEKLGKEYDEDGEMAESGKLIPDLLNELQSLSFYKKLPPKSLGVEFLATEVFPVIKKYNNSVPDILRTYTEHIALQISENLKADFTANVLITGGGAFNKFLIKRIGYLSTVNLIIPSNEVINYKEALIFAFLGVLKMREEVNVLSSVTGAIRDHSSGVIFEL